MRPDSAAAKSDSAAKADSAKRADLFSRQTDLGLILHGRFESRFDKTQNDRCVASEYFSIGSQCQASYQPNFDFKFDVKTGGTIADRVHVNVDYDSKREFDASNSISLYYEGKKDDWLQRVDVGNVSFEVPTSRFITSGIPQGNYGIQAVMKFGALRVRAIAAQQTGNVVRDRVYTVGAHTQQQMDRDIPDYQVEARRFFFTVDPRVFSGYPNIDVLDGSRMRQLALALPDSVLAGARLDLPPADWRPAAQPERAAVRPHRQLEFAPRPGLRAPPRERRLLRRSLAALDRARPAAQPEQRAPRRGLHGARERARYDTHDNRWHSPDVVYSTNPQYANLLWDPQVRPGDPASFREMRSAYRVGGGDLQRQTLAVTLATGATGGDQKPLGGSAETFLQLFGIAQGSNPSVFDVNNRLWPRPGDPVYSIGGTASTQVLHDQFIIFPSIQPFARAGLAQPATNPSNDDIYSSPGEYLYSPQHPQSVYTLHVHYESTGGGDGSLLSLGTDQIRPGSERLTLDDGTALKRDVDYHVDYDVGTVTFLHADTLFVQPRNVTVRYEQNPLFATTPTNIFGIASTLPFRNGEINFIGISQSQSSTFTRPPLGYQDQSEIIAGVNGAFTFDAAPLARMLSRLPGATANAPAKVHVEAEMATSRPQPGGTKQAYIESFEGQGGITAILLADPSWYLSSQPALGANLANAVGGALSLDVTRASTIAWQSNGLNPKTGQPVQFTIQQIDPQTDVVGGGLQQPEPVLWMTLYPLSIGGLYNTQTKQYEWQVPGAPSGRRWRSIRQPLAPAGVDLTRVQDVEFWALVDTTALRRSRNPTIVVDLGDVSENTVATGPTQLAVASNGSGRDSVYTGRAVYGRDTLQSERDPFSRAFNQATNDVGLPGDVIPSSPTRRRRAPAFCSSPVCSRGDTQPANVGDTRTNCTVANGRLDEWDLDGDHVLNFDSSQREQERLFRFVVDLSNPKSYVRVGGCQVSPADSLGPAGTRLCWVQVKLPYNAPFETINGGPIPQRVQTVRVTMISGAGMPDNEFTQVPIARLLLQGAPWTTRSGRAIAGIGGQRATTGFVSAGVIGTQDQDSLSGLNYQSPPGVVDQSDKQLSPVNNQRIVINETSMRITATALAKYERAEAYLRFPEGAKNFMQYKQLRAWARGRGNGWGQSGELQFYIKIGRDADNFYAYHTPANSGSGQAAWNPQVLVDLTKLQTLRAQLQNNYLQNRPDSIACTGADSALIAQSMVPAGQVTRRYAACADGYIVYTVDPAVSAPNLYAVQEMAVGIVRVDSATTGATRILPGDTLEVWVDDITLSDAVVTPGYAGQVGFDIASDLGSFRMSYTHRDPNFHQLAELPTYVSTDEIDVSTTVRLERFLPRSFGYAIPVTVSYLSSASAPLFVTNSDIRASDLPGLRTPHDGATAVALSVRRTTPLDGGWAAPIVNHLSLYGSGQHRRLTHGVPDGPQHAREWRPRLRHRWRPADAGDAGVVGSRAGVPSGLDDELGVHRRHAARTVSCRSGDLPVQHERLQGRRDQLELCRPGGRGHRHGDHSAEPHEPLAQRDVARAASLRRAHRAMGTHVGPRSAELRRQHAHRRHRDE